VTREEGQALVKRFDGEFPDKYFGDIMKHIEMEGEHFHDLCNKFKSPHLWVNIDGEWKLRHTVNNDGVDDK